jgi:hypothetical protein
MATPENEARRPTSGPVTRQGSVMWDIGVNIGIDALYAAVADQPGGRNPS